MFTQPITKREAAKLLGISRASIDRLIGIGKLDVYQPPCGRPRLNGDQVKRLKHQSFRPAVASA
jgi:excisionase family DNA binding protein